MAHILRVARGALFLDDEAISQFSRQRGVFARGLLILIVVSLIVGFVGAVTDLLGELTQLPFQAQEERFEEAMTQALANIPWTSPEVEKAIGLGMDYARAGFGIGLKIAQLPTPLPHPAGAILRAIGTVLSAPLSRMGGWMLYALLVMIAAKILGGSATVRQMLGCTALYAVPHLINVLGFIPCIGDILWFVSVAWGIIIYVKAVAVSHTLDTGRALLAVVLPILVFLFLALVVLVIALVIAL